MSNNLLSFFLTALICIVLYFLFKDSFRSLLSEMAGMLKPEREKKKNKVGRGNGGEGTLILFESENSAAVAREDIDEPVLVFTDDAKNQFLFDLASGTTFSIGRNQLNGDRTISREHLAVCPDLRSDVVQLQPLNQRNPLLVVDEISGKTIPYSQTSLRLEASDPVLVKLGNCYFTVVFHPGLSDCCKHHKNRQDSAPNPKDGTTVFNRDLF